MPSSTASAVRFRWKPRWPVGLEFVLRVLRKLPVKRVGITSGLAWKVPSLMHGSLFGISWCPPRLRWQGTEVPRTTTVISRATTQIAAAGTTIKPACISVSCFISTTYVYILGWFWRRDCQGPGSFELTRGPKMTVGAARFELATSCSQSRRANQAALRPAGLLMLPLRSAGRNWDPRRITS